MDGMASDMAIKADHVKTKRNKPRPLEAMILDKMLVQSQPRDLWRPLLLDKGLLRGFRAAPTDADIKPYFTQANAVEIKLALLVVTQSLFYRATSAAGTANRFLQVPRDF